MTEFAFSGLCKTQHNPLRRVSPGSQWIGFQPSVFFILWQPYFPILPPWIDCSQPCALWLGISARSNRFGKEITCKLQRASRQPVACLQRSRLPGLSYGKVLSKPAHTHVQQVQSLKKQLVIAGECFQSKIARASAGPFRSSHPTGEEIMPITWPCAGQWGLGSPPCLSCLWGRSISSNFASLSTSTRIGHALLEPQLLFLSSGLQFLPAMLLWCPINSSVAAL